MATFTTSASGTVDTTPPQVLSQIPFTNQQNVPTDIIITIDFDEPVLASGLVFRQTTPFADKAATMTLSPDSKRLTIQPVEPLIAGNGYVLYVMITDSVGNALITPGTGGFFAFSFQTATGSLTEERSADALTVIHSNPPTGATGVRGGPATLTLSDPLDPASLAEVFLKVAGETEARRGFLLTGDGLTLELLLQPGAAEAEATLALSGRARSTTGTPAAPFESRFGLGRPTGGGPHLVFTRPPMGSRDVASDAKIDLGFSAPLDPLSLPASVEALADGVVVTGALETADQGRRISFKPDLPFRPGSAVRVRVEQSMLRAPDGSLVAEWPYELRFAVVGPDSAGPAGADEAVALSGPRAWPADGMTEVPPQAVVVVTWDGPLEAANQLRLQTAAGGPVPFRLAVGAADGRAVATLTPHQLLESGAVYRVTAVDNEVREVEISTFVIKAQN